jgi:hypothetical protein
LREAITATLETLAAGKITAKELPIPSDTRKDFIKYAPGFERVAPAPNVPYCSYTVDGLAKFLGEVDGADHASHDFKATFGALELIDGNGLKEGDIAGLEVWKIDAVVSLRNRTQWGRKAPPCDCWHTDGYTDTRIRGRGDFLLHSLQGAEPGSKFLLDNHPANQHNTQNNLKRMS